MFFSPCVIIITQKKQSNLWFIKFCSTLGLCREIVDNHEKENALNIVTEERTYHIYAESPEDARYIISIYSIEIINLTVTVM